MPSHSSRRLSMGFPLSGTDLGMPLGIVDVLPCQGSFKKAREFGLKGARWIFILLPRRGPLAAARFEGPRMAIEPAPGGASPQPARSMENGPRGAVQPAPSHRENDPLLFCKRFASWTCTGAALALAMASTSTTVNAAPQTDAGSTAQAAPQAAPPVPGKNAPTPEGVPSTPGKSAPQPAGARPVPSPGKVTPAPAQGGTPAAAATQPAGQPTIATVAPIDRAIQPATATVPATVMPSAAPAVFATTPTPTRTATPAYTYTTPAATIPSNTVTYATPVATTTPTYAYATLTATVAPSYGYGAASYGDPYGFTSWLNGVRARYGLRPVGYDPNLAGWAAANNSQQAARGMGHFVMGPARRQNAAIGSAGSVGQQWMNSPAHRAALLDPSITTIGLAGNGSYWTFNAR